MSTPRLSVEDVSKTFRPRMARGRGERLVPALRHTNLGEVMWAVATRSDPATDIDIIRQAWGSLVDPQFVTYTGANPAQAPFNSRAILDACIPFDHRHDFPPIANADPVALATARRKWPWLDDPLASSCRGAAARPGRHG